MLSNLASPELPNPAPPPPPPPRYQVAFQNAGPCGSPVIVQDGRPVGFLFGRPNPWIHLFDPWGRPVAVAMVRKRDRWRSKLDKARALVGAILGHLPADEALARLQAGASPAELAQRFGYDPDGRA